MSVDLTGSGSELASLRRQLAEARENLRLIQERKSQYVMETDIPLDLIKRERQLVERIAELEQRSDKSGTGTPRAGPPVIPDTGTMIVVLDESYDQGGWTGWPTAKAGYSDAVGYLSKVAHVVSHKDGYSSEGTLPTHAILVLPSPHDTMVDDEDFDSISQWVSQGGALLVMGIYLMEAHHNINLNGLSRRLGFEFRHDLTMPPGHESYQDCMRQAFKYADRDLWIVSRPRGNPESHPLLNGVSTLALTSCCTVEGAATPDLTVATADQVAIRHAIGHKDPQSGRLLQITDYVPGKDAPAEFMVAFRHGRGKVVAIGTWKIFLNDLVASYPDGNGKLFQNIIDWLGAD